MKSVPNPRVLAATKVVNKVRNKWISRWIAPEDVRILSYLSSYLWPSKDVPNSSNIKQRVVISLSLLLSAKVINVYVPFLFKDLIDSLSIVSSNADLVAVTPIALIIGYGVSRSTSAGKYLHYIHNIYELTICSYMYYLSMLTHNIAHYLAIYVVYVLYIQSCLHYLLTDTNNNAYHTDHHY